MEYRNEIMFFMSLATFIFYSCSILNKSNYTLNVGKDIGIIEIADDEDDKYVIERSEQFFVPNQDGYVYYEDGIL